jgi:hypothetical protein
MHVTDVCTTRTKPRPSRIDRVIPERETKRGTIDCRRVLQLAGMPIRIESPDRHLATILHARRERVCISHHIEDRALCEVRHSLHDARRRVARAIAV